jgi:tRNA-specific 2-thiouridylase
MPSRSQPTVVAALSGGVDSATAAALLVEAGHRVIGMTLRLYDARGTAASSGGRCCGPRDMEDARRVSAHLGIPFYVVDLAAEFERHVMDDFTSAYLEGKTPNPCARCNQHIKFSPLLRRARALGADAVVTGHYARLEPDATGRMRLRRAVDPDKDQSYFLFAMPADEMAAVRFPLGGMRKEEVRRRAAELGLPNAAKPESQEICFVPDGDYAGFVERRALVRPAPGPVEDESGNPLGEHAGVHRFTVGQRRGLGVAAGAPLYVVGLDLAANRVVVGSKREAAARELDVEAVSLTAGPWPTEPVPVEAVVRYRGTPYPAEVRLGEAERGEAVVSFTGEGPVASPGQAVVFYRGDEVLGGGTIRAIRRATERS